MKRDEKILEVMRDIIRDHEVNPFGLSDFTLNKHVFGMNILSAETQLKILLLLSSMGMIEIFLNVNGKVEPVNQNSRFSHIPDRVSVRIKRIKFSFYRIWLLLKLSPRLLSRFFI